MTISRFLPILTLLSLVLILGTGCQGVARRKVVINEPGLADRDGLGTTVMDEPPADRVVMKPAPIPNSLVDNHPLLSRPRDYYESTGRNKLAKTAAAVVVGVPAGILGELRQIVRGTPQAPVVPAAERY